jgi:hypothetical protein
MFQKALLLNLRSYVEARHARALNNEGHWGLPYAHDVPACAANYTPKTVTANAKGNA